MLKKLEQGLNAEERDERNSLLFLSCILSFTLVIVVDEKETCLLSTRSTDFLTDG